MADLLKERVEGIVYPFKNTGVDCPGPFEVSVMRRPVRHWCWLFTCKVTSGLRKEVVNGLDTDACKMAIARVTETFPVADGVIPQHQSRLPMGFFKTRTVIGTSVL